MDYLLYEMFSFWPFRPHKTWDAGVWALWSHVCPGWTSGVNLRLAPIFFSLSRRPDEASTELCPYYFDQVTDRLPNRRRQHDHGSLRLSCFDSWTDVSQEERRWKNRDPRPSVGIYLNRLCRGEEPRLQSLSTSDYLYLMYGHRGDAHLRHLWEENTPQHR